MAVNDDDPDIVLAMQSTLVPHIDCCATVDQEYGFELLRHGRGHALGKNQTKTCDGYMGGTEKIQIFLDMREPSDQSCCPDSLAIS